jgi:BirA family biotin operon repressor/biotin-[acetyl-CoA-carboxylase] ligase
MGRKIPMETDFLEMQRQMEIIQLEETDSTNNYIRQLLSQGNEPEEGMLVRTNFQTAGKGQGQNMWESEKGANLTFSMLLRPDFIPATQQFLLSQLTALGVTDFLASFCGLSDLSIKWPNDIYWKDRKICGILIENLLLQQTISCTILGVGINMNQTVFRSDAPNPVSAKQITGKSYDLEAAVHAVQSAILNRYMQLLRDEKEKIREDYFNKLYQKCGYFNYKDESGGFSARIVDILNDGLLVLETEAGEERTYAFKEVSFDIKRDF